MIINWWSFQRFYPAHFISCTTGKQSPICELSHLRNEDLMSYRSGSNDRDDDVARSSSRSVHSESSIGQSRAVCMRRGAISRAVQHYSQTLAEILFHGCFPSPDLINHQASQINDQQRRLPESFLIPAAFRFLKACCHASRYGNPAT
jgi:hypothetical protein